MAVHKFYVGAVPRVVTCLMNCSSMTPCWCSDSPWWHDFYPNPDPGKARRVQTFFGCNILLNFYPNQDYESWWIFNIQGPSISCCQYVHLSMIAYIPQWINNVEHKGAQHDCWLTSVRAEFDELDISMIRQIGTNSTPSVSNYSFYPFFFPLWHRWIVLEDLGKSQAWFASLLIPCLESAARVLSSRLTRHA